MKIADIVVEVLEETNNPSIIFGDVRLLDMVAERATHTNLMDALPMKRHSRILDALENDERFEKGHIKRWSFRGNPYLRGFWLIQKKGE